MKFKRYYLGLRLEILLCLKAVRKTVDQLIWTLLHALIFVARVRLVTELMNSVVLKKAVV
jgi:hypothetical protein